MTCNTNQTVAAISSTRFGSNLSALEFLMDAYRDIPAFKRWCASHHIEIDERLEITVSSDNGVSIHTKPNVNIAIGESGILFPLFLHLSHQVETIYVAVLF